jgi:hypothetical protein
MPLLAVLLLAAETRVIAPPAEAAPPLTRGYPVCAGIKVTAPGLATQPRNLVFSSRQILDLQFQARLRQDLQGDHLLQFKVLTPGGFLYQLITVPFVGTAPAPDANERAARARSGAAKRAEPPPPRPVPGYPRPLPVQRLLPVPGDSRTRTLFAVNALLPVAGTSITLSSLYGRWTVQSYLDGQRDPCGPDRQFTIRD